MKKIAFIALSLFAFAAASSCNKCKKCTTSVSTNTSGVWVTQSAEDKYCGDDIPPEGSVTAGAPGAEVVTDIRCK